MTPSLTELFGITDAISSPDAELIATADKFISIRDAAHQRIRRASHYSSNSRACKKLWAEALSTHREQAILEKNICRTPAKTRAGVMAKVRVGIEWLDSEGRGCTGAFGDLALAALHDALRLLNEEVTS